ncbi:MAG: SPOR domain-containing protein, partial [Betaproteobacteria bacterium]|nr:SPOR domain-containing protein [Betaproteobacteria bacterium]
LAGGAAMVEVEALLPGASGTLTAAAPAPPAAVAPVPPPPVPAPEPAAEPPPAASAPQVPVTVDASGVYLQLGAFGSRENAESFLARLRAQAEWLALHVFPRDGLFRVHAGPYASQLEARQVADRISQALGIRPMVLVR